MYKLKTYRGHIRNWKELTDELGICNELSRKEREARIIEQGFAKWREHLPEHIYGMFAFALEDEATGEIVAFRDQFGAKPFYYYVTEKKELLYGTFIRDIIEKSGFRKELNEDMLQIYLSLTYAAGEDTFFKGIKKLLPGYYLRFKEGKAEVKRYWTTEFKPEEGKSLDEWANEIHSTLKQIMEEVVDENESAESFLSGGVDSSYVLAMSNVKNADSVGYDDERFDESILAGKTAELLGKTMSRCCVKPPQYFEIVPWVMKNMEQPLGDASAIAFALGCLSAARNTKICYSGEGSDEFFGGYNMYRNAGRYGDNLKNFYVGNTNIMKEDEKQKLLKNYKPDVLPINIVKDLYNEIEDYDPLTKMSYIDIKIWLEGDIYLNVDKMSSAAGLEIRMPLTDMRIFDIAARMPSEFKVNDEQNKVALRTAAAKVLPEEIAFRKKLGFVVPIRHWMADDNYNADIKNRIFGRSAEKFFNIQEVKVIWDEYKGGNSDLWRKIWTIYTFIVWYDEYFE